MTVDEAIKDIKDNIKPVVGGISLDMAIEALERQRWIPVSEGLPEVGQAVIVTTKNGFRDFRKCIDAGHLAWFYHDTIAWTPVLLEPYQKGE